MDEDRKISAVARAFVARKLEQFEKEANKGSGLYYELFAQNFTDRVDMLAGMAKRPDLREHILSEASKTGNYVREEMQHGRWDYDVEAGALKWNGDIPDSWKQIDFQGQWVRKSADERARYVTGHFGKDSRTQNDYPGLQIEKNGVAGKVKWGPEQPDGQEAQEYAEKMLDKHLGFEAPKLAPSSFEDIRKADQKSERLGAKVLTGAYRKYIKASAKVGESPAQKYGAPGESIEGNTPSRSRSLR